MKKKALSVLVATMLLLCLPIIAAAEMKGTCADNIEWVLDDGGVLTISGNGDMTDYDWSSTAPWNSQKADICKIVIGNGVTSIGDLSFAGCTNLLDISIPDTVLSIGSWAFDSCGKLSDLELPDSVLSIGKMAFWGCEGLKGELIIPDSILSIEPYAFMNCVNLTRVVLPEKLTVLNDGVFESCTSLSSVEIPDGLTSMGSSFSGCSALTKIPTLPKSITAIGNSAFSYCTGITSLNIPEHINTIGEDAFMGCTGLTEIVILESVKSIGMGAFSQCDKVVSAYIPESVTSMGERIFVSCSSLAEVTLPDNMSAIPSMMFYCCESLEEVVIPETVTSIGDYAFSNCTSLKNITLPKNITTLPENIFYYCTSLESIAIPEKVTSIGNCSFYNCSSLSDIRIPVSVTAINNSAFYGCGALSNVYYGGNADDWTSITVSGGNAPLTNADIRYNYGKIVEGTIGDDITWLIDDKGTLMISGTGDIPDYTYDETVPWFEYRDKITALIIENGITKIGDYSFNNCTALINIQIPDTVNEIGERAFNACGAISEVSIPDSVTTIGWFAFAFCEGLEQIKLSENLTIIDRGTFTNCIKLSSIVIPDSVTTIKKRAFECTALKFVTLSANLTTIEDFIFEACDALTGVFYRGSMEEWTALVANAVVPFPAHATIYYNHIWGNVIDCGILNSTVNWLIDDLGNLVISGSGKITSEPWRSMSDGITGIIIGDGITEADSYILQNYNNVKTITIGKNMKNFGMLSNLFSNTYSLEKLYWNAENAEEIEKIDSYYGSFLANAGRDSGGFELIFGDGVQTIPYNFRSAMYIKKIVVPASVKKMYIPKSNIEEVHIEDLAAWCGIEFIDEYANPLSNGCDFYINGVLAEDIVIPDGVAAVGKYAFKGNTHINSITLSDDVTSIGEYSFSGCSALESFVAGIGLKTIGQYAFSDCSTLSGVTLNNGLETIGRNAFSGCKALKQITLPESITVIESDTFSGCSLLESVTFGADITNISEGAFSGCTSIADVYYGGSIEQWENVRIGYYNDTIKNANVHYNYVDDTLIDFGSCGENVSWTISKDGVLTISGTGAIEDFSTRHNDWLNVTALVVSDGITGIPDKLFYDHANLFEVTIAGSVKFIGEQAFCFCDSLCSVTLEDGIETLGDSAFLGCSSLKEITIPGSIKNMTHNTFADCTALEKAVIEEGVTYIYNDTFHNCTALKYVSIPKSVNMIGTAAFGYCTSLESVAYQGTETEFDAIDIDDGNKSLVYAYKNNEVYLGNGKCGDNLEWTIERDGTLRISGTGEMYDFDIADAGLPWYKLADSVRAIVIEEGVESIGGYTFWMCFGVNTLTIPNSVKKIGRYIVGNCDRMEDVYYIGSEADWDGINVAKHNPYLTNGKIRYIAKELNIGFEENRIYINSEKEVREAVILVALYNENGDMLGTKYVKTDISKGISEIESPIADYLGADSIKIMGWRDLDKMESVFDCTEIEMN